MKRIDNDAELRELSRLLWEKAGRPNGFEHEYWALAAAALDGRNDNPEHSRRPSLAR